MTNLKLFSFLLIFSLFLFTSCDKDDESNNTPPQDSFQTGSIVGEKGCNLEIIRNGETEPCTGEYLFGWESGQLLNSNYFKQVRFGCEGNSFALRFSIPAGTSFQDFAEGEHDLYGTRLLLQNTTNLDEVYVEFFQNSTSPEIPGNSTGTVEIRRDVAALSTTYSLVGNIDATFFEGGMTTTVKGQFWSENAPW